MSERVVTLPPPPEKLPMVALCTPSYQHMVRTEYLMSIMKTQGHLFQHEPRRFNMRWLGSGNIGATTRMRNYLVAMALKDPDVTHVLFVDSDIGWEPQAIEQLLFHDRDIIGALQPVRDDRHMLGGFPYGFVPLANEDGSLQIEVEDSVMEVWKVPTAFLLIKREVFEDLYEKHPDLHYDEAEGDRSTPLEAMAWFNYYIDVAQDGTRTMGGEDYGFMKLCHEAGYRIYCDPTIPLTHGGNAGVDGTLFNYMRKNFRMSGPDDGQEVAPMDVPNMDMMDRPSVPVPEVDDG